MKTYGQDKSTLDDLKRTLKMCEAGRGHTPEIIQLSTTTFRDLLTDYIRLLRHERKPKAYKVLETTEDTGGIVYAKTNGQARRLGCETFGDGDFSGWTCHRAPEFDHLYPVGPDLVELFHAGWFMDCRECGCRATHDSGGVVIEDDFYCGDHADVYAWREVPEYSNWSIDDFVWRSTAASLPAPGGRSRRPH